MLEYRRELFIRREKRTVGAHVVDEEDRGTAKSSFRPIFDILVYQLWWTDPILIELGILGEIDATP